MIHSLSISRNSLVRLFAKYLVLFLLLWLSIASICFRILIIKESNPFFYANF